MSKDHALLEGNDVIIEAVQAFDRKGRPYFKETRRKMNTQELLQRKRDGETARVEQLAMAKRDFQIERSRLLTESDWVELPSAKQRITEAKIQEWMKYRQTLRDMPRTIKNWHEIEWPKQPN